MNDDEMALLTREFVPQRLLQVGRQVGVRQFTTQRGIEVRTVWRVEQGSQAFAHCPWRRVGRRGRTRGANERVFEQAANSVHDLKVNLGEVDPTSRRGRVRLLC